MGALELGQLGGGEFVQRAHAPSWLFPLYF
jgi:hypothetical protein